jgi:hypothetical protein
MKQSITILYDKNGFMGIRKPLFIASLYNHHYSGSGEWSKTNEGVIFEGYTSLLQETYPDFGRKDYIFRSYKFEGEVWKDKINKFLSNLVSEKQPPKNNHDIHIVGLYNHSSELGVQSHIFDNRTGPNGESNIYTHHITHNFSHIPLTEGIIRFLNEGIVAESNQQDYNPTQKSIPYFPLILYNTMTEQEIDSRIRERLGKTEYNSIIEHDIRGVTLSLIGDVLRVEEPYFEHGLSNHIKQDCRKHGEDWFVSKGINTHVEVPLTEKVRAFFSELKAMQ